MPSAPRPRPKASRSPSPTHTAHPMRPRCHVPPVATPPTPSPPRQTGPWRRATRWTPRWAAAHPQTTPLAQCDRHAARSTRSAPPDRQTSRSGLMQRRPIRQRATLRCAVSALARERSAWRCHSSGPSHRNHAICDDRGPSAEVVVRDHRIAEIGINTDECIVTGLRVTPGLGDTRTTVLAVEPYPPSHRRICRRSVYQYAIYDCPESTHIGTSERIQRRVSRRGMRQRHGPVTSSTKTDPPVPIQHTMLRPTLLSVALNFRSVATAAASSCGTQ